MTTDLVIYGAGPRDPVQLDPAEMQFKAQRARSCRACLFHGQWVSVCNRAGEEAVKRGMPDCGDSYVYVSTQQMSLLSEAATVAAITTSDHNKPTRGSNG
jgi:hypothetical protein